MQSSRPLCDPLLNKFCELKGSDLYLTVGRPPSARLANQMINLTQTPMDDNAVNTILAELLSEPQLEEFRSTMEFNMPMQWNKDVRLRINVFFQRQHPGIIIRRILTEIPTLSSLHLPPVYSEFIMEPRGLILVAGPTGSGKTTSLAAMIGHRNQHSYGHIVTIEDPIEYVHEHQGCIITQRDVGIDTYSFGMALKNVLRQRPDVVLIGEIRERETMEHALHFAETGHLCVATIHAGNTTQALERVLNFFPEEKHYQVRQSLANNLNGILSQKLVLGQDDTRMVAVEIMKNRGLIRNHVRDNKFKEISDIITKNRSDGMQTFEQSLFELYTNNHITEEIAMKESDNPAALSLMIRQHMNAKRGMR